jgi:hypothetical protein
MVLRDCPGAVEHGPSAYGWAIDLDPLELRRRNEPDVDTASVLPFTTRPLLA